MKIRFVSYLLVAVCFIFLFGCGKDKQAVTQTATEAPVASVTSIPTIAPSQTPDIKLTMTLDVYYGNEAGDDLVVKQITVEQKTDTNMYLEVLNALKKSPEEHSIALLAGFTFLSAKLDDHTLTVDLALPEEPQLGSNGEQLLVDALSKTIFQFQEVEAIELLVNGQKADSLLGHVQLAHPITK